MIDYVKWYKNGSETYALCHNQGDIILTNGKSNFTGHEAEQLLKQLTPVGMYQVDVKHFKQLLRSNPHNAEDIEQAARFMRDRIVMLEDKSFVYLYESFLPEPQSSNTKTVSWFRYDTDGNEFDEGCFRVCEDNFDGQLTDFIPGLLEEGEVLQIACEVEFCSMSNLEDLFSKDNEIEWDDRYDYKAAKPRKLMVVA